MPLTHAPSRVAFSPEKLSKTNLFSTPEMFLDVYGLEPGQAQKVHAHAAAAKFYYVLEGEGTFTLGTEEHRAGPGHAVFSPAGEEHGVRNEGPDRLVLLVGMAPNPGK